MSTFTRYGVDKSLRLRDAYSLGVGSCASVSREKHTYIPAVIFLCHFEVSSF